MSEQDTAREAAFQDAWEASFTRLGIEEDPYRIAQAFYRAAWAAGVAHGRAEPESVVELLRELYEYSDALEQRYLPSMMKPRSFEDLPGTAESRKDLGDRVRAVLAVRAAGDRG